MKSVMQWLLEQPADTRIEIAAHVIEQLIGGDARIAWIKKTLGVTESHAKIAAALEAARPRHLTKEQIATALYYDQAGDYDLKIVDVFVCHLRKALPKGAIRTVWGAGYELTIPLPVPEQPGFASLDEIAARPRLPDMPILPRPKSGADWTDQDDSDLRAMFASGSHISVIAEELDRTERAVGDRIRLLGLRT